MWLTPYSPTVHAAPDDALIVKKLGELRRRMQQGESARAGMAVATHSSSQPVWGRPPPPSVPTPPPVAPIAAAAAITAATTTAVRRRPVSNFASRRLLAYQNKAKRPMPSSLIKADRSQLSHTRLHCFAAARLTVSCHRFSATVPYAAGGTRMGLLQKICLSRPKISLHR